MNAHKTLATVLVAYSFCAIFWPTHTASGNGPGLESVLVKAKKNALETKHLLQYKFTEGETIQWKVRHLGTTEATVQGNTQTSKMRAVSTKQWKVTGVDNEGNATFVHSVLDVNMWQKVSGREEVRYDSSSDETPPPEYRHVAKTVGVPLSTVTISPSGRVLERDKTPHQLNSGLGEIAVPLPDEPVKVGQDWRVTNEIRVRRQDGKVLHVKTRRVYTLESVKTGIATITVRTEVLTPVNDPRIEAQLVQQLVAGELKFDVDAGRVISREIDWDETIVGFGGHESVMKYLARFTEELIPTEKVARQSEDSESR